MRAFESTSVGPHTQPRTMYLAGILLPLVFAVTACSQAQEAHGTVSVGNDTQALEFTASQGGDTLDITLSNGAEVRVACEGLQLIAERTDVQMGPRAVGGQPGEVSRFCEGGPEGPSLGKASEIAQLVVNAGFGNKT